MKESSIKILRFILKLLAKGLLWRYRPGVIGVTGSVGKTSSKIAIASVFKGERYVRASAGNFNNEIGLPLTILGNYSHIGGIFFWARVIIAALWKLTVRGRYPELLILEYGIDKTGDMKELLDVAKPNIGVITAIGEIPVHVEFFAGPEALAREKSRLIEYLPAAGFAVLNYDDMTVMDMKERTRARVLTFGFGEGADVRITNFETRSEKMRPLGIAFKLEYGGSFVPVRLDDVFGKAQGYAAASAACVGLIFGMNLVKIAEALQIYKPVPGRMALLDGVKDTFIIDDSYNAAPLSMHAALDTLRNLKAKRKVAVLGDMLEIGKYTIEAHEEMGRLAGKIADLLFTVGARAKFIAEAAKKAGLPRTRIFSFDTAEAAAGVVQEKIRKGDLILIKASRGIHLEKIVEEIKLPKEVAGILNRLPEKIRKKNF